MEHTTKKSGCSLLIACMLLGIPASGFAASPRVAVQSGTVSLETSTVEMARRRGRSYGNRSGNAFPAAALGLFALGTAAAIASQNRNSYGCGYYNECDYNRGYYGGGHDNGFYGGYSQPRWRQYDTGR